MPEKEFFYLGFEGPDHAKLHQGIAWLLENSKQKEGWIGVSVPDILGNVTKHPGFEEIRPLYIDNATSIELKGIRLQLVMRDRIPEGGLNKPLLAIYPPLDFLKILDEIPNISKVLVIPWLATEADEWVIKNKAVDLDSPDYRGNHVPSYPEDIDKTIQAALRELTERLNQKRDLYVMNFYHYVVSTFKILSDNGHVFEPDIIRAWLTKELQWGPVSARYAAELADAVPTRRMHTEKEQTGLWTQTEYLRWRQ